jgi:hypothetical protein
VININGVDIYNSTENNLGFVNLIKTICFKRELLMQLLLGDLRSRYRRSVLGLFWTLVNPIISSLVLWVVFVSIFKSNLLNGTQFAPYLMAGVLTITFFNQGLMQAAESVSNGARLFLKIKADPRLFCISNSLSNAVLKISYKSCWSASFADFLYKVSMYNSSSFSHIYWIDWNIISSSIYISDILKLLWSYLNIYNIV